MTKLLNFTIYFDEKTNRIKRIFVHSAWCDYNCENCPHESLCDRIHNAIEASIVASEVGCSDCVFIIGICGLTSEDVQFKRTSMQEFQESQGNGSQRDRKLIRGLNSRWNRDRKERNRNGERDGDNNAR